MQFMENLKNGLAGEFCIGEKSFTENIKNFSGVIEYKDNSYFSVKGIEVKENTSKDLSRISENLMGIPTVFGKVQGKQVLLINGMQIQPTTNLLKPDITYWNISTTSLIFGNNVLPFLDKMVDKIELLIPNINRWIGHPIVETSEDKSLISIDINDHEVGEVKIDDEFILKIQIVKNSRLGASYFTTNSLVKITIESINGKKNLQNFIYFATALQDLISFAYKGFVPIEEVLIIKDGNSANYWLDELIHPPLGHSSFSQTNLPLFRPTNLGGIDGIAKWLREYSKLAKAIGPISYRWSKKRVPVEILINNIGVGVEAICNIATKEEKNKFDTKFKQYFTAQIAGEYFSKWLSKDDNANKKFAELVKHHYNKVKHNPKLDYDLGDTFVVAEAAAIMLKFAIFEKIFPNTNIAQIIYNDVSNSPIRNYVANLLEEEISNSGY